jgi:hypothetical protein
LNLERILNTIRLRLSHTGCRARAARKKHSVAKIAPPPLAGCIKARQVHASLYIVELTQEASVSISTTLGRSTALMSEEAVSSGRFANSTVLIMVVGC